MLTATDHVPEYRAVLSNISGSVSIACWIILLLPQLLEQWRLKSADGVSLGFIMMWFFGDLANLFGSIIGQLRPSLILLALWFCFSDTLLGLSYCYYKRFSSVSTQTHSRSRISSPANTVQSPDPERSGNDFNFPSPTTPLLQESGEVHTQVVNSGAIYRRNWLLSTGLPAVFVIVVATLSYFISDSAPAESPDHKTGPVAETLGYISAFLYLIARIPQIIQNHRRRSVEGLSMGFFTLSIIGNLTYAGQVIIYRTDRDWLIAYIPWLLGSLGTIAEDLTILAQFHIYKALST